MLDDERDKQLMRNQMIAIILMTLTVVVWFSFFAPEPPVRPPQEAYPPAGEPQQGQVQTASSIPQPSEPLEGFLPSESATSPAGEWPNLPPAAEPADTRDDEVTLSNQHMEFVFTRVGARLKQVTLLLHHHNGSVIDLVPTSADVPDVDMVYPFGLRFTDAAVADELDRRRFDYEIGPSGDSVTFSLTLPSYGIVRKTFSFTDTPYVFDVDIEYENLEGNTRRLGMDHTPAYILTWGPDFTSHDEKKSVKKTLIWRTGAENSTLKPGKLPTNDAGTPEPQTMPGVDWLGTKSAYFMVAFKPEYDNAIGWAEGREGFYRFGVSIPRFEVGPGEKQSHKVKMYVGPMSLETLGSAWPTLNTSLRVFESFDSMDWFAKSLLRLLNWFYGFIPNYGIAIILLTVVVRVVMFPLTLKSMKSMKKMQQLAPEMEELRERYKEDPQELNKKTMEMYRERGINPLGGCFPILLQMPIFIALYRMLWNAYELRGAPFFGWIKDLSEPDRLMQLPFMEGIPFVGSTFGNLNLLPILMALSMLLSQKVAPTSAPATNPQQKMMMNIMPIFFGFICYNMAAGLNLYIFTSTILGIVQQYFIKPGAAAPPDKTKKKKVVGKKQHFYTAAKARQREAVRESKRGRGKAKVRR